MITGQRVVLRAYREDDLEAVYRIFADLDSWPTRDRRPPHPLTVAGFRDLYVPWTTGVAGLEFVVEVDGHVVGRCGMFDEDPLARHAEVGIALAAEARGRGYGTDAMRTLVGFLFTCRNLQRIHLETLADNAAALASYRKVGFVQEGVLRRHAFLRGEYVDAVVMGLLCCEWTG